MTAVPLFKLLVRCATAAASVSPSNFFGGSGWFIRVLQAKVAIVGAVIALSCIHDFVLGPRVARRLEEATFGRSEKAMHQTSFADALVRGATPL